MTANICQYLSNVFYLVEIFNVCYDYKIQTFIQNINSSQSVLQ